MTSPKRPAKVAVQDKEEYRSELRDGASSRVLPACTDRGIATYLSRGTGAGRPVLRVPPVQARTGGRPGLKYARACMLCSGLTRVNHKPARL